MTEVDDLREAVVFPDFRAEDDLIVHHFGRGPFLRPSLWYCKRVAEDLLWRFGLGREFSYRMDDIDGVYTLDISRFTGDEVLHGYRFTPTSTRDADYIARMALERCLLLRGCDTGIAELAAGV